MDDLLQSGPSRCADANAPTLTVVIDDPGAAIRELLQTASLPNAWIEWALSTLTPVGWCEAVSWIAVADLAVKTRQVNVPIAALARKLEVPRTFVNAAVERLALLGLVSVWQCDVESYRTLFPKQKKEDPLPQKSGDVSLVTLTRTSADMLGLKLGDMRGRGQAWIPRSKRDPPERRRERAQCATDLEVELDEVAGDSLSPDQIAAAREQLVEVKLYNRHGKPKRCLPETLMRNPPRPWVILTGCATVWEETRRGKCSACGSEGDKSTLKGSTYCARCSRWSLDWLLQRVLRKEAEAALAKAKTAKPSFARRHHHGTTHESATEQLATAHVEA